MYGASFATHKPAAARPIATATATPAIEPTSATLVNEPAVESVPTPAPTPALAVAAPPTPQTYVVQEGDTVKAIAAKFGVSAETVMWANELHQPDLIQVGQSLLIPATSGVLYHAKGSETLRDVAQRFHADPLEIAAYNGMQIDADETLPPGDLIIPNGRRDDFVVEAPPTPEPVAEAPASNVEALGSVEALAAPAPTPQPVKKKPAPIIYEVKEGDTLRSLALLFGVDIDTLLNANNIPDPDLVTVGTKLTVLPVSGVQYTVGEGETLADIAGWFQVDGGAIADFNGLENPDLIQVGQVLIIPGAKTAHPVKKKPAPAEAEAPASSGGEQAAPAAAPAPRQRSSGETAAPAAPAQAPAAAPDHVTGGGAAVVQNAMAHLGQPYVWGGVGPRGFDCSGFVYYILRVSGHPVSRGLWGQLNGGPRISRDQLQPGDTVFFANTYMPGLSHAGIYIGGGRFIHASDPSTGVTISSLSSAYWASRYVGASRLW